MPIPASNEPRLVVLAIEDNPEFRSIALQTFEGAEKLGATTAAEGLRKFKESYPDITLLDIGLPDKSGLDLLPELLAHDPEAFIIMLTASPLAYDVQDAKAKGAAGYIIKPFTRAKILECIKNYENYKTHLRDLSHRDRMENYTQRLRLGAAEHPLAPQEKPSSSAKQPKETVAEVETPLSESVKEVIKNWTVLFVDDYFTNRERAQAQLSELGCKVDIAQSGEELLEKTLQTDYDFIFLDTQMKGMDGYRTTRELRIREHQTKHRSIVIGMVESLAEIEDRSWLDSGMNDHIRKPARFSQLRDMMEKHATRIVQNRLEKYVN